MDSSGTPLVERDPRDVGAERMYARVKSLKAVHNAFVHAYEQGKFRFPANNADDELARQLAGTEAANTQSYNFTNHWLLQTIPVGNDEDDVGEASEDEDDDYEEDSEDDEVNFGVDQVQLQEEPSTLHTTIGHDVNDCTPQDMDTE